MNNKIETGALIVGVAAVTTLVFFLITSWGECVIPFEPNSLIRIPEIIIGILSIPVLCKLIWEKCI